MWSGHPCPPLYTSLEQKRHITNQSSVTFPSGSPLWQDRTDFFAAGNLTIFYSPVQDTSKDFRGPDFFLVLDTVRKPRRSWTVWKENGKFPNVIIEVLSKKTAKTDR